LGACRVTSTDVAPDEELDDVRIRHAAELAREPRGAYRVHTGPPSGGAGTAFKKILERASKRPKR
jgi:hypothetical protein